MKKRNRNRKENGLSIRVNLRLAMSLLAVSLIVSVVLLNWYTIQEQTETIRTANRHTLSIYCEQMNTAMETTSTFLSDSAIIDSNFNGIVYAKTKTEAYASAVLLADKCRLISRSEELIGAFFILSEQWDFSYHVWAEESSSPYSYQDIAAVRSALARFAENGQNTFQWVPLRLSDRIVFLYARPYRQTVLAAMIDPTRQSFAGLEPNSCIFYALEDGTPCSDAVPFDRVPFSENGKTEDGRAFELISLPLSEMKGTIVYAFPFLSLWEVLDSMQILLLLIAIGLLASIPLCWGVLQKWLLKPLNALTGTLQAIQSGHTEIRVPQGSPLHEANEIAATVNTMLDVIQKQKIDSYEYQLKVQHAQLQYLQLQIRPHFFLNCLNMIYFMAQEKKYKPIQDLTVNLSVYLRNTFRNSANLVLLKDEIHSVDCYMQIQQLGMEYPPKLTLDMSTDVMESLIPPLSILSFVENSVKHSRLIDAPLEISIKCRRLPGEGEDFLNISICDNCGGIPNEKLQELNQPTGEIYTDQNVGTSNVKQRLKLMYDGKAVVSFSNKTDGACVELFIPIQ